MSDHPQGPGWWLASDGRYYPPESAHVNPTVGHDAPSQWGVPPGGGPPGVAPPGGASRFEPPAPQQHLHYGVPGAPPPGAVGGPPPVVSKSGMPGWAIVLVVIGLLLILGVGGCAILLARGTDAVDEAFQDALDEASAPSGEERPEYLEEASCRASSVDNFDDYRIELTVENPTAESVSYTVDVRLTVTATGEELGTEQLFTFAGPGAQDVSELMTLIDATVPPDEVTCEPISVAR